jgi:hypothetical protein
VNGDGVAYTQKRHPRLSLIEPHYDVNTHTLWINAPQMEMLQIQLPMEQPNTNEKIHEHHNEPVSHSSVRASASDRASDGNRAPISFCSLNVCGRAGVGVLSTDPIVTEWFTKYIGTYATLAYIQTEASSTQSQSSSSSPSLVGVELSSESKCTSAHVPRCSFSNEGEFLAVHSASLSELQAQYQQHTHSQGAHASTPRRNICTQPYMSVATVRISFGTILCFCLICCSIYFMCSFSSESGFCWWGSMGRTNMENINFNTTSIQCKQIQMSNSNERAIIDHQCTSRHEYTM